MLMLDDALQLALDAHRGQTDKNGQPYILHPLRLMMQIPDKTHKIIAVLHDVVEDSATTLADLRAAGYSETIVNAVDALTRRDDEGYMDYVQRAAKNPIAKRIKLADLEDNMNMQRLSDITEDTLVRLKRYHTAWQFLQE